MPAANAIAKSFFITCLPCIMGLGDMRKTGSPKIPFCAGVEKDLGMQTAGKKADRDELMFPWIWLKRRDLKLGVCDPILGKRDTFVIKPVRFCPCHRRRSAGGQGAYLAV